MQYQTEYLEKLNFCFLEKGFFKLKADFYIGPINGSPLKNKEIYRLLRILNSNKVNQN